MERMPPGLLDDAATLLLNLREQLGQRGLARKRQSLCAEDMSYADLSNRNKRPKMDDPGG